MNVTIRPSAAHGIALAPPSKSMTHRLLIGASLADGKSTIRGVVPSDDVLATVDCLRALGVPITESGDTCTVAGSDPATFTGGDLSCRESGTTLRMLVPLLWRCGRMFALHASPSLLLRPMDVLAEIAAEKHLIFRKSVNGFSVGGQLTSGDFCIRGSVSSQFVSGLLFALPTLPGDSTVTLLPPVVSRPYLDMTVSVLRSFGVSIREEGDTFFLPGGQRFRPVDTDVPGDWSNAAFLDALGFVGGDVRVSGLSAETTEGDGVYPALFERIRCGFAEIDLADTPDLGPILFVVAALFFGARFTGTARLRTKESDRVAAMTDALARCGIRSAIGEDEVTVFPGGLHAPAAPLSGAGDHRVVMALTVLLSRVGGTITGAEAVRKSYPDFFPVIRSLGIDFEMINETETR